MNIIRSADAPGFAAPGATFTGYAAPSRGADRVSLWSLELAPGSTSPLHRIDCEEIFLGLEGRAVAAFGGAEHAVGTGDCLVVPADTPFTMHVPGAEAFRAVACMRAGGQATLLPDG